MLTGCNKTSCEYAVLGGEVINRNTDYVVLFNSDKVIDTVKLNDSNRFLYKIEGLNPGFYTFKHGGEIQMVLLEPGDSLMFRLNTFDFDESLVYTGKGAKKNNYLINDFLKREREEKLVYRYCQLKPDSFEQLVDSIRLLKTTKLEAYKERHSTSELFNKIAHANIDYDYYSSKEVYPFVHYGRNKKKILDSLPKSFYDYRSQVNYNDDFFKNYFNYTSFLKRSFNTIGLQQHLKHTKSPYYTWANCNYSLDIMSAIDSLITNAEIKNDLLYHYTMRFLAKNKHSQDAEKVMDYFLSKNKDAEKGNIILSFKESIGKLRQGAPFPEVKLRNVKNELMNLRYVTRKPTVVYFWSHLHKKHFNESHRKANEFRVKYPEVEFISINVDDYSKERWASTIKKKRLPLANEFILESSEQSYKELAIHPLTKVFLLDENHNIVNPHTNMFSSKFEEELLGLINKQNMML